MDKNIVDCVLCIRIMLDEVYREYLIKRERN